MAAPDTNLSGTQVLLTQSDSGLGVISLDNKTQFGVIAKVSDLCDNVAVGNYVMYNPKDGRQLLYGSTIYILINEESISGVEVIIP